MRKINHVHPAAKPIPLVWLALDGSKGSQVAILACAQIVPLRRSIN